MAWNSFGDFLHMGGYALYVWGAYGVTLATLVAEAWLANQRRRRALRQAAEGDTA